MVVWRSAPAVPAGAIFWVWYVFVAVGQALDVVLTRLGLSRGVIAEANPLMAPIVHTPIPIVLKAFALLYLAAVIAHVLASPRGRPLLLWSLRFLAAATAVVLLLHAWALLIDSLPPL